MCGRVKFGKLIMFAGSIIIANGIAPITRLFDGGDGEEFLAGGGEAAADAAGYLFVCAAVGVGVGGGPAFTYHFAS